MESEITKERDGIQLRKYYEETEFEHPSVVYEFESLRVEPVTIHHLSENVPKSAEPTDIGFHRDFGSEHWHIEGHTLQFEYEVEGDAEYRTVYAVKPDKQPNAAELMVTRTSLPLILRPKWCAEVALSRRHWNHWSQERRFNSE